MKRTWLITTLISAGAILASFTVSSPAFSTAPVWTPPSALAGDPPLNYRIVRAEYADLDGNRDHIDTLCHIANTNATTPLYLQDVYVVGKDGIHEILAAWPGLLGHRIHPLGSIELPIDSSIPGVFPETSPDQHGVAHVVISWTGPQDALRLTALIERNHPDKDDYRTRTLEHGFALTSGM